MLYKPYLQKGGLEPRYLAYFEDDYLLHLYAGAPTGRIALRALGRRLRDLRQVAKSDLLWIEKEALPWLPWLIERLALPKGVPFAVDYDDAVFHRYDLHRYAAVRAVLGDKLDRLMAAATLVTAGNAYLAERATQAGARWVEIVPTVVDTNLYRAKTTMGEAGPPRIGWIGSPSTWAEYMLPRMPMLTEVAGRAGARIMAVGAGREAGVHPLLENRPWSEDREVADILDMDLGLMPLMDTPWARGKCGYKLIQYMACGLPVIASPVGVNREIVQHGGNGFLAETDAEWRAALSTLLADPALRMKMGQAGRKMVEERYSLQVWGPRVAEMLARAATGTPSR
jgi:glycosyltransferase involved in cell wall biosynthesis